jgi:hypothetical protein
MVSADGEGKWRRAATLLHLREPPQRGLGLAPDLDGNERQRREEDEAGEQGEGGRGQHPPPRHQRREAAVERPSGDGDQGGPGQRDEVVARDPEPQARDGRGEEPPPAPSPVCRFALCA